MNSPLLPQDWLINCLNAAIAALMACAVALVLSRRTNWSLPTRHALLVAGLGASLLLPLVMPLVHLPTFWAIPVAAAVAPQSPPTANSPLEIEPKIAAELPDATLMPVADAHPPVRPFGTELPAIAPAAVVPDRAANAATAERPSSTAIPGARIVGTLLCGLWFAGISIGAARSLLDLLRLRRWLQTVTTAESPLLVTAADEAAKHLGLRQMIAICTSSLLPAPISCGLLRPRIVVPAGMESSLSHDQLLAVVKHEMAHVARGDLWTGLLQQAAAIVYWWNPLVYLANRRLADLREQICDDIAIGESTEPSAYAATLLALAERCSLGTPVPATLGIGSSSASQLERRIRRILSSSGAGCVRLSRWSFAGVSAAALLMTATILLAQVKVKPTAAAASPDEPKPGQAERPADKPAPIAAGPQDPTLHDLIQQMAMYERIYLPFDIQVMETWRYPDDLTPQERAKNLRADGRKHQRLMEYAQLAKQIWRSKETDLVDDERQQGPYERFSDGERIVQRGPSSVTINGVTATEYYIEGRKRHIEYYLSPASLLGVFCLSQYSAGELFFEAFKDEEEAVELAWDNGDAKMTFAFGKPDWNTKYVLWLSRAHAWHPIRWQRYWDAKDEFWFDEWEVTRFVPQGKLWRVAEGTHRYRDLKDLKLPNPKIKYSMDFKVLSEKYGSDVDDKQFHIEIPPGAKVREEDKPDAEPPLPAKTREITVTVVDVSGKPIPKATVQLPASRLRNHDVVTTDEQGIAKSFKAPADDVTVQITADGFRPVTWIMGDVNELRAIMTPQTTGVVVDGGKPVADAWITNESLQIRADGYTYVPNREWDGRDDAWSGADGTFNLKSNLTLRRTDAVVPLISINPDRDKMAIRFVKANELGQPQPLALQGTCHVTGRCLLTGVTQSVKVGMALTTPNDQYIGSLSPRRELTSEGLRVDYQLRLPPGDYVLKTGQSSHHSGFTIPVTIPNGKTELDLGTKVVPASGTVALQGKPAPKLELQWRPGEESSWEKLRGKVAVLDFWGTWCGPCVDGMPELMAIADQFRDKPVQWLSIHTAEQKSFEQLDAALAELREKSWNKRALPFTTAIDAPIAGQEYAGITSERFGVAAWPTLIVIDQEGNVVGAIRKQDLAKTISRLLKHEER